MKLLPCANVINMRAVWKSGSSSVEEPITLTKYNRRYNPNNSYKTKKNFTSFYTEVNPEILKMISIPSNSIDNLSGISTTSCGKSLPQGPKHHPSTRIQRHIRDFH